MPGLVDATVEIVGTSGVAARLREYAAENRRRAIAAVRAEFGIEMAESMKRTPKLTRKLERSHRLEVDVSGDDIRATITAGEGIDYAIAVHEKVEIYHRNGQAKFLESTILESYRYMAQRLANRLRIE